MLIRRSFIYFFGFQVNNNTSSHLISMFDVRNSIFIFPWKSNPTPSSLVRYLPSNHCHSSLVTTSQISRSILFEDLSFFFVISMCSISPCSPPRYIPTHARTHQHIIARWRPTLHRTASHVSQGRMFERETYYVLRRFSLIRTEALKRK